jgi:hypothetical protein
MSMRALSITLRPIWLVPITTGEYLKPHSRSEAITADFLRRGADWFCSLLQSVFGLAATLRRPFLFQELCKPANRTRCELIRRIPSAMTPADEIEVMTPEPGQVSVQVQIQYIDLVTKRACELNIDALWIAAEDRNDR